MDATNQKLLEQAARSIEDPVEGWTADADFVPVAILRSGVRWQPLLANRITDCMGDALRLAVKLCIDVLHRFVGGQRVEALAPGGPVITEYCDAQDRAAATRRAITRAAAMASERGPGDERRPITDPPGAVRKAARQRIHNPPPSPARSARAAMRSIFTFLPYKKHLISDV